MLQLHLDEGAGLFTFIFGMVPSIISDKILLGISAITSVLRNHETASVRLTFEPSKLEALADIVISLGLLTGRIRVAFLDYLGTTHDSAIALTAGLYSSCKQLAPYCLLGDSAFCNGPGILSLSESVLMDIDVTVAREDDDDEFINTLMNSI